jgi:hypothetical protein
LIDVILSKGNSTVSMDKQHGHQNHGDIAKRRNAQKGICAAWSNAPTSRSSCTRHS